jgi:putative cell wall-binding protein/DNA-binding beta-propeller fold protein YncE
MYSSIYRVSKSGLVLLALLAATAIGFGTVPTAQATHIPDEKLYVGQKDLDNIAIYDVETLTPHTVPTISLGAGAQPEELVADTHRPYLYVADSALKVIHVIDTNVDTVEYQIPLTGAPQGLALSEDGYYLYVAQSLRVDKIDTRNRTVVASSPQLSPAFVPWDIAINSANDRVWVTNGLASGEVRSFKPDTLVQFDTITPTGGVAGGGILPNVNGNATQAAVADPTSHMIRSFDDVSNVTTNWATTGGTPLVGPWAIEQERQLTTNYLVTDSGGSSSMTGDSVYEFSNLVPIGPNNETKRLTGLGGTPTDDAPQEIAFGFNKALAFVTLRATNKVSVINYEGASLVESAVLSLATGANPYGVEVVSKEKSLVRFAGANRYDTARKVSMEAHADKSVDALAIASGQNHPDGLVAAPFATMLHGPLLLSKDKMVPDETKKEIARVFDGVDDPEIDVWLVGGTTVLGTDIETAIQSIDPKIDIGRAAGSTRFKTAVEVAKQMDTLRNAKPGSVFIAKGSDYPDALAASGYASNTQHNPTYSPILLTESDKLNADVDTYLASVKATANKAYLAGGTTALSTQVASDVGKHIATVTRLGGANRYGTAVTMAKFFFPSGTTVAAFVLGTNFPDALVMGALTGIQDASGQMPALAMPTLLVKSDKVTPETADYLATLSSMNRGYIAGGFTAITQAVQTSIEQIY